MTSKLYEKTNYISPYNYLISRYIREYDISKANISVLYSIGHLDKEQYENLYNMSKMQREITIGLMIQSNPQMGKDLKQGILELRKLFFEQNSIEDYDVLAIKNDAIFLIDKIAYNTKFNNIEFKFKNTYTSFYRISIPRLTNLELYYYVDEINEIENLTIKGIKEKALLHNDYFIDFLKTLFFSAESDSIEETIKLLVAFYNKYINLELDIGYYREFNSDSAFKIKKMSNAYTYKAEFLSNNDKQFVDISCNLEILRSLNQIYSELLFSRGR